MKPPPPSPNASPTLPRSRKWLCGHRKRRPTGNLPPLELPWKRESWEKKRGSPGGGELRPRQSEVGTGGRSPVCLFVFDCLQTRTHTNHTSQTSAARRAAWSDAFKWLPQRGNWRSPPSRHNAALSAHSSWLTGRARRGEGTRKETHDKIAWLHLSPANQGAAVHFLSKRRRVFFCPVIDESANCIPTNLWLTGCIVTNIPHHQKRDIIASKKITFNPKYPIPSTETASDSLTSTLLVSVEIT